MIGCIRFVLRSIVKSVELGPPDPLGKNWQSLNIKMYDVVAQALSKKMSHGDVIFDAGCGLGVMAKLLHCMDKRVFTYIGCDIDGGSLRGAYRGDLINYVACDLQCPPFKDGSFDIIICREVLEHIPKPYDVLRKLCRISRRTIFLTFPYSKLKTDLVLFPDHLHQISLKDVASVLKREGFAIGSIFKMSFFPHGLWKVLRIPFNSMTLRVVRELSKVLEKFLFLDDVFISAHRQAHINEVRGCGKVRIDQSRGFRKKGGEG